jgi:hypothetical protein
MVCHLQLGQMKKLCYFVIVQYVRKVKSEVHFHITTAWLFLVHHIAAFV